MLPDMFGIMSFGLQVYEEVACVIRLPGLDLNNP